MYKFFSNTKKTSFLFNFLAQKKQNTKNVQTPSTSFFEQIKCTSFFQIQKKLYSCTTFSHRINKTQKMYNLPAQAFSNKENVQVSFKHKKNFTSVQLSRTEKTKHKKCTESHKFFRIKKMYKFLSKAYEKMLHRISAYKKTFFSTQKLKPFYTIFGNCFLFWCSFCSKKIKKIYSKLPPPPHTQTGGTSA